MPVISPELRAEIEEYLRKIPEFDNPDMRKRIARYANLPDNIFGNIDWSMSILRIFTSYLIDSLLGSIIIDEQGEENNALIEYLKASRSEVNTADARVVTDLIDTIEVEFANQPGSTGSGFKFVNRNDEISELTAELADPRYAINAPAGFGKTWLLGRLSYIFTNKRWVVAKAVLDRKTTVEELATNLIRSVDLNIEIDFAKASNEDVAEITYGTLNRIWENRNNSKGVVLLIDTRVLPEQIEHFDDIAGQWLPALTRNFQDGTEFFAEASRFRIVLAGRFIDTERISLLQAWDVNYAIKELSPFSVEVIARSVNTNTRLKKMQSNRRIDLIAFLFYFSGGHPAILNKLIEFYLEKNKPVPEKFFDANRDLIEKLVKEELEIIFRDIPEESRKFLLALSPMRYMNLRVIDEFVKSPAVVLPPFKTVHAVVSHLTRGHLLAWEGDPDSQFLSDDISRRIMALYIRLTDSSESGYSRQCSIAKETYGKRLSDGADGQPVRWAMEYLYQSLHGLTYLVNDVEGRRKIRRMFWGDSDDGSVPPSSDSIVFDCLLRLKTWRDDRQLIGNLLQFLSSSKPRTIDWEFVFNVNFYLREEQFSTKWFGILLGKIQSHLNISGSS